MVTGLSLVAGVTGLGAVAGLAVLSVVFGSNPPAATTEHSVELQGPKLAWKRNGDINTNSIEQFSFRLSHALRLETMKKPPRSL